MEALLGLLFTKAGGYVVAALGAGIALLSIYFKGRSAGAAAERAKQDRDTFDLIKEKKDEDEAVGRLSDGDARRELSEWTKG